MPILWMVAGVAIFAAGLWLGVFTIPLLVIGAAAVMIGFERAIPGRNWPAVPGWWFRVIVLNAIQVLAVWLAGVLWEGWMKTHRPWSADWAGPVGGAFAGYLAITFVFYWWHRWRHEYQFLWNWLHQVHHSPQRIEVITSFYKHPFELISNSLIVSTILYMGVGLSPEAAAGALLLSGWAELFYHWNVPTPYWIGYIIQRPESHCVHHQMHKHTSNFGDLPIWDILFGTFDNPREFDAQCGFKDNRELKLGAMLLGEDVNPRKPRKDDTTGGDSQDGGKR